MAGLVLIFLNALPSRSGKKGSLRTKGPGLVSCHALLRITWFEQGSHFLQFPYVGVEILRSELLLNAECLVAGS